VTNDLYFSSALDSDGSPWLRQFVDAVPAPDLAGEAGLPASGDAQATSPPRMERAPMPEVDPE